MSWVPWVAGGVGVVALFGFAYWLGQKPPPPPSQGLLGQPNLVGAVDQGSQERTAWVTLVTEGLRAGTSIYTNETARARAASGGSVPPGGPVAVPAAGGAGASDPSASVMHVFDDWGW